MNFKLKPLVASMALIASGAAFAAGFTPPESAAVVDRLELERNHNGRFSEPADWFRRITLSGELNVEATASNKEPSQFNRFIDRHSSDIALADANFYLGAQMNDWIMANVDLVYEDPGVHGNLNQDHNRNRDTLDEAYLTIGDFRQSPFYVLAGREYVPYGHYVRHPITAPLTQLLTQTNATALQVGFVDMSGFNGSVFVFRNKISRGPSAGHGVKRIENGGAQIGYTYEQGDMGINLDASWLANLNDVDYLRVPFYWKAVGGYSLVAEGHYMGFDGELQYTRALDDFVAGDVAWGSGGAKPGAWLAGVGFTFPVMGDHQSRIGVNYQRSKEAADFSDEGLPKKRWQADYTVNVTKNTDIAFQYVHDKDYSRSHERTGHRSDTGIIRLSTRFA